MARPTPPLAPVTTTTLPVVSFGVHGVRMMPHARWCGPSGSTSSRLGAAGVVPGTAGPPAAGKPVAPAALLGATGGMGGAAGAWPAG